MKIKMGTCHFESEQSAVAYYYSQGFIASDHK